MLGLQKTDKKNAGCKDGLKIELELLGVLLKTCFLTAEHKV